MSLFPHLRCLPVISGLLLLCLAFPVAAMPAASPWCAVDGVRFHPLTDDERDEGWLALFDGSSISGWRAFHSDEFPVSGWQLEGGTLFHREGDGRGGNGGGDLLTRETYANFEFAADWCLQPGGNSGIKYLVVELAHAAQPHRCLRPRISVDRRCEHADTKQAIGSPAAFTTWLRQAPRT
jgi:hypothetical protein